MTVDRNKSQSESQFYEKSQQAIYETKIRRGLIDRIRPIAENKHTRGFLVLGSVAWAPDFAVLPSSDLDLQLMFSEGQFKDFLAKTQTLNLELATEQDLQRLMLDRDDGILQTIKCLAEKEFAKGSNAFERTKELFRKFITFSQLHSINQSEADDLTGYDWKEKQLTDSLADYLAYNVVVENVDVSIHVMPEEIYLKAADLDLTAISDGQTVSLNEIRFKERKKKAPVISDNFVFYKGHGFSSEASRVYGCEVSGLRINNQSGLSLHSPASLAEKNINQDGVEAWVTRTPITSVLQGHLYNGLVQDKIMWSVMDSNSSVELQNARKKLLTRLSERFAQEVETGVMNNPSGSILRLAVSYEKIPDDLKRNLLMEMKTYLPQEFKLYQQALRKIGSDELKFFKVE